MAALAWIETVKSGGLISIVLHRVRNWYRSKGPLFPLVRGVTIGTVRTLPPADSGSIILVGVGPGDVELLTIKALRAIEAADVILHDALVTEDILALAPTSARLIPVGKRGGRPSCSQNDIDAMMITHAKEGRKVVRLKSGDPSVFGRSGEEMSSVRANGIAVSVIPGVTTAFGNGRRAWRGADAPGPRQVGAFRDRALQKRRPPERRRLASAGRSVDDNGILHGRANQPRVGLALDGIWHAGRHAMWIGSRDQLASAANTHLHACNVVCGDRDVSSGPADHIRLAARVRPHGPVQRVVGLRTFVGGVR